jgi:hypothetical protein
MQVTPDALALFLARDKQAFLERLAAMRELAQLADLAASDRVELSSLHFVSGHGHRVARVLEPVRYFEDMMERADTARREIVHRPQQDLGVPLALRRPPPGERGEVIARHDGADVAGRSFARPGAADGQHAPVAVEQCGLQGTALD